MNFSIFQKHYLEYIQQIGEGSFGKVYKAFDIITKQVVAVKILNDDYEQELLQQLNHKNIVKLIRSSTQLYVMEYMEGGSLTNFIKLNQSIPEEKCCNIMKAIFEGLQYLHSNNIIHRDIKPDNIMLSKELIPKIGDFGLSIHLEKFDFFKSKCGTFIFMAPEILLNKPYSKPVDMWAAAIIMYMLLQNQHPYYKQDMTKKQYLEKILEGKLLFKKPISNRAKDLLERLLRIDVALRYNVSQTLQHPWFTNIDQVPMSLQEQFQIFACKTKFINIIKTLLFLQKLKIPKLSYGYILGLKGFHIRKVKYQIGIDISPKKSTDSQTISSSNNSKIKISYSEDNSPADLSKINFQQKSQRLQRLSNFYEQASKAQENIQQQTSNISPSRLKKTTMTITQASREYADIMLGYNQNKLKRRQSQIKLDPLEQRNKRTSSMVVLPTFNT